MNRSVFSRPLYRRYLPFFLLLILLSAVGTVVGICFFNRFQISLALAASSNIVSRLCIINFLAASVAGFSYFSCLASLMSVFNLFFFSFINAYSLCYVFHIQQIDLMRVLLLCGIIAACQLLFCIACLYGGTVSAFRFQSVVREEWRRDRTSVFIHVSLAAVLFFLLLMLWLLLK